MPWGANFRPDKHGRWGFQLPSLERQALAGSLCLSVFTRNNVLDRVLCRMGSGNCQTKKPDPVCLLQTLPALRALQPLGTQESLCLPPAAASGRCPFRNSALQRKSLPLHMRASLSNSIAAYFKSFICLEFFQTVPYLPMSSFPSSPPPFFNLPKQIHIINISVSAVRRHWLHCNALHQ